MLIQVIKVCFRL